MSEPVQDERLPVWEALSDFFLDTELQPSDYERIATTLAQSKYTLKEIKDILDYEVYPVCISNLLDIAGEWAGFPRDWLVKHIAPLKDKRPRLRFPRFARWMIKQHWKKVSKMIEEIRNS